MPFNIILRSEECFDTDTKNLHLWRQRPTLFFQMDQMYSLNYLYAETNHWKHYFN
jgi:hypothetical protein